MASFNESSIHRIVALNEKIVSEIKDSACFESAAKRFVDLFYEQYEEHLILARVFVTIPFANLPDFNRRFVENLMQKNGITDPIQGHTPVLSLMATRGRLAPWNDRKQSSGHVGIPLFSKVFIEEIPMLARLLKDFGMGLDWVDGVNSGMHVQTFGKSSGVFYVPDAATSLDEKGRKIIPMQDFVAEHNVKSVFGIGGGYATGFMVAIFFCNEYLNTLTVRRYESTVFSFTRNTFLSVHKKDFFEGS